MTSHLQLSFYLFIIQGLLKIWTEHSHWFLLNQKPFEITLQKFQHFYNSGRNEFSPNLEGVAWKLDLPRPFDVLETFGGKSKSKAPRALKFGTKRVPIEVNNWWKFGVDILNHFWDIQNWSFCHFNSFPMRTKINFKEPYMDVLLKTYKISNGHGRPIFWHTTSKFSQNSVFFFVKKLKFSLGNLNSSLKM